MGRVRNSVPSVGGESRLGLYRQLYGLLSELSELRGEGVLPSLSDDVMARRAGACTLGGLRREISVVRSQLGRLRGVSVSDVPCVSDYVDGLLDGCGYAHVRYGGVPSSGRVRLCCGGHSMDVSMSSSGVVSSVRMPRVVLRSSDSSAVEMVSLCSRLLSDATFGHQFCCACSV